MCMRARACSRAGTCSASARRGIQRGFFQFFFNAAQHDTNAKTFTFPIYPTARRPFRRERLRTGMQDGLDLLAGWRGIPRQRAGWPASSGRFSSARFGSPTRLSSPASRTCTPQRLPHGARRARGAVVAGVRCARELFRQVLVAGRVRRPRDERSRLRRIPPQQRAGPAVEHGAAAVRTAGRGGMGARHGLVYDGGHARADEFRVHADVAAAQRHRGGGERATAPTPEALLSFYLDRLSPAPFEQNAYSSLLEYLRGGVTWTGSARAAARQRPPASST